MPNPSIPLMVDQVDPISPLLMLNRRREQAQQAQQQQQEQQYQRSRQQQMDALTIADLNQQHEARGLQMQGQKIQNNAASQEMTRAGMQAIARDTIAFNNLVQGGDLQNARILLTQMKQTASQVGLPVEGMDKIAALFNTPDQLKTESATAARAAQAAIPQLFADLKDANGNIIGQRRTDTGELSAAPESMRPQQATGFEIVRDAQGNPIAQRNTQNGQVSALPETMTPKPQQISGPQSLAAGYAQRALESSGILDELGSQFTGTGSRFDGRLPREMQSDQRQLLDQAARNFVNTTLRRESGAAISESEFENARQQYIPQPGDSESVLAQKKRNRDTVAATFRLEAGPAFERLAADLPAASQPAGQGSIGRFQVEVVQ